MFFTNDVMITLFGAYLIIWLLMILKWFFALNWRLV